MHAAGAHDEMQRSRKQNRNQHIDPKHHGIGRELGCERQHEQTEQNCGAQQLDCETGRPQRVLDLGRIAYAALGSAEQPIRPRDQHDRHDQKFRHQRELGKINREDTEAHHADADAERLHLGDDERGQERAGDRAHAADHHDDEGVADHDEVERQIGRLARDLQGAAQAGQERTERKDDREQHRLIDAESPDHLAILRGCPDQPSEPGLGQHKMQEQQHERADKNE